MLDSELFTDELVQKRYRGKTIGVSLSLHDIMYAHHEYSWDKHRHDGGDPEVRDRED